MGLIDDLAAGSVGIDTAIFVYFIEAAPVWLPAIVPLFREADLGHRKLVTSAGDITGSTGGTVSG